MQLTEQNINIYTTAQFEILFKSHFVALCSFARKYIADTDSCKEIVHDIFINLWNNRDKIDESKSIKSYLYTSVHNRCLNYIRDNKKFSRNTIDIETIDTDIEDQFNDNVENAEVELQIKNAIDLLPVKCKEIFVMSRYDELTYNKIAEQLNISVKTVEAQISKALKILREELKEFVKINN